MSIRHLAIAALAVAPVAAFASADVVWDEAIDGDLSDDYLAPTQLDFATESSTVIFTTDREGDDRDLFTFTVAEGFELTGIILDYFITNGSDPSNLGFMAFSTGEVLGTNPDTPDPSGLLGYALPMESDSGTDFFYIMANGGGAQGYDGPLGAGPYTFWAQETSPTSDDWSITFVTSAVPSPGALALLGLAGLTGRRRRG